MLRVDRPRVWSVSNFLGRCRSLCVYRHRGLPADGSPPAPIGLVPSASRSLQKRCRSGRGLFGGIHDRGTGLVTQDTIRIRRFVWSNAVLPYVRRNEFVPVLQELRRIQRPDGVSSHRIPIKDIIGGNLNDLRFSSRVWESSIMANSGFYTNRLRYLELLQLFRVVGFEPEVVRKKRWQTLPTPRRKMSEEFARLTEEDLHVCEFDVLLR
jgi:hypothetical protein